MSYTILEQLLAAIGQRRPVVLATVVETSRSVPRRAGSKMLVYGDGSIAGSVGGGEMESRVVAEANTVLATGRPVRLHYGLVDPASGDPGVCGGEVELYLEPYMPKPTVFVVGAGHVGQAVVELARWLDLRVVVWDDRPHLLDEIADHRPIGSRTGPETELLVASGPIAQAIVDAPVDANTWVVMVTRNVALDVQILPHLLATPAPYIGLMGSNRRWETTRNKLVDLGFDDSQLDRVTAPIGLEIGAETPAQIAVSILGQVIVNSH